MAPPRINQQIRISPVLLVDADGTHRGAVPLQVARDLAVARGLDLVEIAPLSTPPGVRIMNWTEQGSALR